MSSLHRESVDVCTCISVLEFIDYNYFGNFLRVNGMKEVCIIHNDLLQITNIIVR